MKRLSIILAALFCALSLKAQNPTAVKVEQSDEFSEILQNLIETNSKRRITGYRIRIYFDNVRDSRQISESIAERFAAEYPEIPVYKSYSSPFFKVTVGDFRTRDEAALFAKKISGSYSSAFLVKEAINYPAL